MDFPEFDEERLDAELEENRLRKIFESAKLTDQQAAFVRHRLDGCTQAKAAELAGYQPDGHGEYRAIGSKTESSKKVRFAIKQARKDIDAHETSDMAELERGLWQSFRQTYGSEKMKAAELLMRIDERRMGNQPDEAETLQIIAAEMKANPKLRTILEWLDTAYGKKPNGHMAQ